MAVTFVSDARGILDEADSITGWTGSVTVTLNTSVQIESTGCLSMICSTSTEDAYTSITSDDYSGGGSVYAWVRTTGTMDTLANGGVQIVIGDGTNRIGYHVGGSDQSSFRHETGPVEWACFILDAANKPANFTAYAGSEASLNEAAITQVGVAFKTLAKAVGGVQNVFWDIMRFGDNGNALVFRGGSTSGTAGNMSEVAAIDLTTGNQQAYGVVRELGEGVYGIQGNVTLGDSTSASDQYWDETNVTYAWENRGQSTNNYYRFALIGSSTATNCEFSFVSSTFNVPAGSSASFDGNGADITVCTVNGCTLIGFDQGVITSDDAGDDWTSTNYVACDQVEAKGCDMDGSSITDSVVAADTGALLWNIAADPNGELDNMFFSKGTNAHHAIEFGTTAPTTMTLTGLTYSGFNAANGQNDSTLLFPDKGSDTTWTVNISGGSTPSYKKARAGDTVNIVSSITVTFTGLQTNTEVRIYNTGTTTEIDGVENSGTSFAWAAAASTVVDYVIHHVQYEHIRVEGYTVPASNTSIPIQQRIDRNYSNP